MRRLILPISLLVVATFALQETDRAAASTNELSSVSGNTGISVADTSSSTTNNGVEVRRGDIPLDDVLSSVDSNWRGALQQAASSSGVGRVPSEQGAEQEQSANEQEAAASTANQQPVESEPAPAAPPPPAAPAAQEQAAPPIQELASTPPPQAQEAPAAPAPAEAPVPATPAQPPIRQQARPVVGQVAGAPPAAEQEGEGEMAPNVQNRQVVTPTYTLPESPTGTPGYTDTTPAETYTPLPTTITTPTLTTTRMPTTGVSTITHTVTATPLPRPSAANSRFATAYSSLLIEVMLLSFVALAL
ncbi:hypothetical protein BDB00DRAFT_815804 [Zychaea mexicana]|uniref:uncharacterized protein n=1 Tax=Zychaea mexicana TaxID=64656 RepID=UPI0022FE3BFA|nr:uncharacterized protein BDB00DRAFT_815804 [Zychaea mexicana]KAI9495086.1 hypothetical protein BDB00DRAFT_815804 [Zychaea mexicana]